MRMYDRTVTLIEAPNPLKIQIVFAFHLCEFIFQIKNIVISESADMVQLPSCNWCYVNFEETGSLVRRILPCGHSTCNSCVENLIRKNTLVCPECRKEHGVPRREKSLGQNEDLLVQIHSKTRKTIEELHGNGRCTKHGEDLLLYCQNRMCKKPICVSCLSVDHKKHEVVGIREREKDTLIKEVNKTMMSMQARKELIYRSKKDITSKTESFVKKLKKRKRRIQKMIQEAESQMKESKEQADDELSVVIAVMEFLSNLQKSSKTTQMNNHLKTIMKYLEKLTRVMEARRLKRRSNQKQERPMKLQKKNQQCLLIMKTVNQRKQNKKLS